MIRTITMHTDQAVPVVGEQRLADLLELIRILIEFLGSAHDRLMDMTDPGGHVHYARPCALMRLGRVVLAALVAGHGVVTACGDDPSEAVSTPGTGTSAGQGSAGHEAASPGADGARRVPVTGRSFSFEPEEITVKVGEDIAIVLTSEDSLHDFTIDELDAHVAAEPGETAVGGFRAEEPGRYSAYCSVAGHRDAGMEGVVVVED